MLAVLVFALLTAFTPGGSAPPPPVPPPSEVALHRSLGMQGVPYVYGGTTPAGFDCSGLTQWAYAQSGTRIPRTTWEQYAATVPVSEPAPGDLIFFNTLGGVSHVGINIDGQTFIHAQDYGEPVQIEALAGYWARTFIGFGHVPEE